MGDRSGAPQATAAPSGKSTSHGPVPGPQTNGARVRPDPGAVPDRVARSAPLCAYCTYASEKPTPSISPTPALTRRDRLPPKFMSTPRPSAKSTSLSTSPDPKNGTSTGCT